MADKIVVMHDGLVEQIGAPLELYDRPENLFVAGFIGSPAMNFLQGTIRVNGAPSFERAETARACRSARLRPVADGRAAVYGIRPEHSSSPTTAPRPIVQVIEPTGSEIAGRRQARRRRHHRGVPRASSIQAGRQDPAQARSAARPSVRRGDGTTTERLKYTNGRNDHDHVHSPHIGEGRHGGRRGRRADRPGLARMGQGLGASGALEARERRAAFHAALEVFRAVGGRRLRQADRGLHPGDRREGQHLARVLRGRAAEGLGRRQHRRRSGPVLGPLFAAASVPAEMRRCHRRRRLSRQEIRRLGRQRGAIRQERQQVDRGAGLLQRQPDELPHRGLEEGRLLRSSRRPPTSSSPMPRR